MSDTLHRLRGTWRQDRHAARTVGATARAVVAEPVQVAGAPGHLQPETARWYAHVAATWELEPHHLLILQAASEAWDQAQLAREAVTRDGLTVPTADGGCKAHPCLTAATAARGQFASLVAQLDLDDAGTPGGHR